MFGAPLRFTQSRGKQTAAPAFQSGASLYPSSLVPTTQDSAASGKIHLFDSSLAQVKSTPTALPEAESIYDEILWTPFTRSPTLDSEQNHRSSVGDPYCDLVTTTEESGQAIGTNYQPYDLFCLKSHLSTWMHRAYDSKIHLVTPTVMRDGKQYVTIVPYIGATAMTMTQQDREQIQKHINYFTQDFTGSELLPPVSYATTCVVMPFASIPATGPPTFLYRAAGEESAPHTPEYIPESWIRTMLPFVSPHPDLNPYINNEGLVIDLATLPDQLSNREGGGDYMTIFSNLSAQIVADLQRMYAQGWIWSPSAELIQDWNLVSAWSSTGNPNQIESGSNLALVTNSSQVSEAPVYRLPAEDPEVAAAYSSGTALLNAQQSEPHIFRYPLVNNDVIRHGVAVVAMEHQLQFISTPNEVIFMTSSISGSTTSASGSSSTSTSPTLTNSESTSRPRFNYPLVRQLVTSIRQVVATTSGAAVVVDVNRLGRLILMQSVMEDIASRMVRLGVIPPGFNSEDIIGYQTSETQYRFSTLLPYGSDISAIQEALLIETETRIEQLSSQTPSNISVLEAVERGLITV